MNGIAPTINQRGLNLIKRYEGVRLVAYKPVPTERFWTIGYGHYGPDVKKGQRITQARAEAMLRADIRRFEVGVWALLKRNVNPNRFAALVSLAYNIGLGNLATSTVLRETNVGHYRKAAVAFRMWTKGGNPPVVLAGLVKRRASEAWLYSRPIVRKKR